MMAKDMTGIVALDARRGFGRGGRSSRARPRNEDTRVHRLLTLAEKTADRNAMLLRECDHRIKNSLQIVSSLLMMQSRRSVSIDVSEALVSAASQVRAVSQMHDALQHSEEGGMVKLGAVLATMCQSLHAMAGDSRIISIVVTDETIEAPVAIAQPIVLAVNELVINALRHAFIEGLDGAIHVSLRQSGGELCVVVSDNGCGLPAGHAEGAGYGMRLVRAMVRQIGGKLLCESNAGARFTITVPFAAVPAKTFVDVEPQQAV